MIRRKDIGSIARNSIEKAYWAERRYVCGIDEAGRGPLAGPVVAAAVVIPIGCESDFLRDSKVLSEVARLKAYTWILKNCAVGIGIENHTAIDTHNIYQATLYAMCRAFCQLHTTAQHTLSGIIVDAMPLIFQTPLYQHIPVHAFIEAESRSSSVAAASIVAKVVRDRIMAQFEKTILGYQFEQHKGYGTALHQARMIAQGRSLIHRSSFLFKSEKDKEYNDAIAKQSTIWGSYSEQP